MRSNVVYREVQRPRSALFWIFIGLFTVFFWYIFIQQIIFGIPVGTKPAPDVMMIILWLIFGILMPIIPLFFFKLIIEVREDGLYLRYIPFHFHYQLFLFKDIKHYESVNYSPTKRFGGWGIRVNGNGETGYTMGGNRALELQYEKQTIVIGTRNPDKLEKTLKSLEK